MNNQEKGIWFLIGWGSGIIIICAILWIFSESKDDIKPGDIVSNGEKLAVVISVNELPSGGFWSDVYPIKVETWQQEYGSPKITKFGE